MIQPIRPDPDEEKAVEIGTYKGYTLILTSKERILVLIYDLTYPAYTLPDAKKLVDDLMDSRKN